MTELIERADCFRQRTCLIDENGCWSYETLLSSAQLVASGLLRGRDDLEEARVAFQIAPGLGYVTALWGIWAAGGVAVPLGLDYPLNEIDYMLRDTEAEMLVTGASGTSDNLSTSTCNSIPLDDLLAAGHCKLPRVSPDRRAMILYTSGTTAKPKGVVTTHANIAAQIRSLVEAWEWCSEDSILNPLPLHHVHGIINIVSCALWSGACCRLIPRFETKRVFSLLSSSEFSIFMAVPTIYTKLIAEWESCDDSARRAFSDACAKMRLMVSGSAALPQRILERWYSITGHTLLERYGMTEIGMALSNPLRGSRRPGFVGAPLPGVEVRLVDERGADVTEDDVPGEILVRGGGVFREYWRQEKETVEAFEDGWFRTGDIAIQRDGSHRIQGRKSTDIIKTGGFKVSALEIEEALREYPEIKDCVVVGVPDREWGELVAVAVLPAGNRPVGLRQLQTWAVDKLARQKIPRRLLVLEEFPRNAMGKVVKPEVRRLFASAPADVTGE